MWSKQLQSYVELQINVKKGPNFLKACGQWVNEDIKLLSDQKNLEC